MKKIEKFVLMSSALLLGGTAWAEDFGDFGGFGDDASDSTASKLEVSGGADTELRAYVDVDEVKADNIELDVIPSANLELKYSGNKSDVELNLKIDEYTIKNHPEDIIDEAVLRGRFGDYFTLEAGKMKVVWGKGDKLHVLDNFNADDYSDFIIPDYLDRRISTPMVRGVVSLPVANLNLEGIYTPLLPADRFATDGRWTPAQVIEMSEGLTKLAKIHLASAIANLENARLEAATASALEALGTSEANASLTALVTQAYADGKISADPTKVAALMQAGKTQQEATVLVLAAAYKDYLEENLTAANTEYTLCLANANNLSANPDVIYPNLWTLKYGQFGARATWTLGQVDMGVSYYNGWYKQPSVNASKVNSFLTSYLSDGAVDEEEKFLAYDKKQTFGLEASTVLWHFNVRGEFAYNLTDDIDGTDPWVHNNSIAWLGGFDIDLPFWNANLNVQEIGSFVFHGDECDKNALDVDYGVNGYTNNKIVCNITTSFMNDKIAPEVTVMYGIENKDLVVMPKLAFNADQNLTLTASGMYIWCGDDNSEFKSWEDNSFVSLAASYQF
ncbi:hypothetical protein SAMN04487977_10267 [Treponema bryantii]|uniref:Uncharacterized protein n=1 Tax=Treponema bryantii TaxID=163 RepID=A0A1H9C7B7_9SPIR|nr:hypothetical protein [Treponema bryantii]SEP96881.1 hypothetical protein SAMN04487977_10267 [Treponema bryantii]